VQFEITEGTRQALLRWVESPAMLGSEVASEDVVEIHRQSAV
jgi:hypothetical protein